LEIRPVPNFVSASSGGAGFWDSAVLLFNFTVWWTGQYFYHRRRLATLGRYNSLL